MGSISQKDTTGGREDETVSDKEPLERNNSERDDREEEERQCVFTTCQSRVEVSKTWQLIVSRVIASLSSGVTYHENDECGTCQDPCDIS
jgi:hypothetical protein